MSESLNFPAVVWPPNITDVLSSAGCKVSVSRVKVPLMINPTVIGFRWEVSVYKLVEICRVCGEVKADVARSPQAKPACDRHSWDLPRMIVFLSAFDSELPGAIAEAETKAEQYLANPGDWRDWRVEYLPDIGQYLTINR